MSNTRRLSTTIDSHLADRLDRETVDRVPKLTKRYFVELALKRLFDDIDQDRLGPELPREVRD